MKKIIAVNGSARENGNTAQLLQSALRGAADAGAETRLVHLGGLNFSGCRSCFACKRLETGDKCRCYWPDDLSPVLDALLQADAVLLGSPIYFGDVSGMMRCFLERLSFITLSYHHPMTPLFKGSIDGAFFFTMNEPESALAYYDGVLQQNFGLLKRLGGECELHCSCFTVQFDGYGRYHTSTEQEAARLAHRETQFAKELRQAYEVGQRLAQK